MAGYTCCTDSRSTARADALKVASKGAEDAFTKLQTACDTLAGLTSELKKLEEQEKPRGTVEKKRDDAIQVLESYVGPEANRKELLRLGRVAEDKNLDEATRLLDSYLRLIPKDQKEQLHIGLLYAEKPDSHATFVIYPRIVRAKNPAPRFSNLKKSCAQPKAPCPRKSCVRPGGRSSTWRFRSCGFRTPKRTSSS